eukprot:7133264-Pyramimonas_sp.AAC.1
MVEISSDEPTHYDRHSHSVSILDRFWRSWPGWIMAQLTAEPGAIDCPERLAETNVSDHAARAVKITQRSLRPAHAHRVPRHLFESDEFQKQLKIVCDKLNYADKSPPRKIELHKWAIREVAADLRDRLCHQAP